MSRHDALAVLPGLRKDNDGPIFREPWEAQAFAMTLLLHEKGLFTWQEWTQALSDRIAAASETGEPDTGETYYLHWLAALEALVAEKGLGGCRAADVPKARLGRCGQIHTSWPTHSAPA